MDQEHTCCFTGVNPQELPWGYDEEWEACVRLKRKLAYEIEEMLQKGITVFISGMAVGVDLWAAECVLGLKRARPQAGIRRYAAIPFEGQADKWSIDYRERYDQILAGADGEVTLHAHYSKTCMRERSRYMVDHAAHMIAVCSGRKGAAANAVQYAESKGLHIVIIDPNDLARTV